MRFAYKTTKAYCNATAIVVTRTRFIVTFITITLAFLLFMNLVSLKNSVWEN
jgi:hypothetical protein